MVPSLEDVQSSLNKACQLILDISKGLYQWGQDRNQIEAALAARDRKTSTTNLITGSHQGIGQYFLHLDVYPN